jgi:hypothetical protein
MTIVGKILVFVVLVFSLLICAFTIQSYAARVNYDVILKEAKKQITTSTANASQFHEEMERVRAEADSRVAAADAEKKTLREESEGYKSRLENAGKSATEANQRAAQFETAAKAAQADVSRRQADVEKLRETNADLINQTGKLTKDKNDLRDRAVAAEIQATALKDRLARTETQMRDLAKALEDAKKTSGSGGRTLLASSGNPPPEHVEGLIKTADPGGLLKLTIGSDAGLVKGNTLEVFRLSPIASQSKYLGKVRVLDVTPHEAVAQPIGRLSDKPQAGDHVADRIFGGA